MFRARRTGISRSIRLRTNTIRSPDSVSRPVGADGFEGVGQTGGVGAEQICQDVRVKWRAKGKCLDQLVNDGFEGFEQATEAFGEAG